MTESEVAALIGRIGELERHATALRAASDSHESMGKVDLLLASLQCARVSLRGDLDDDAHADLERMVDTVGHRLTTLQN